MHGSQWPKVGATLALMWLKRFEKFRFCVCSFWARSAPISTVHVSSLNQGSAIYSSLPSEHRGRWKGWAQPKPNPSQCHQRLWSSPEKISRLVGATALQGEFRVLPSVFRVSYMCILNACSLGINLAFALAYFRRLFSLLPISPISWGPSQRVGTSKMRSAWRKSENSSSTSPPLLMLLMRCTIRWMPILISDPLSLQSHLHSSVFGFAHLDMVPFRSTDSSLRECIYKHQTSTSNVCAFNHLCACSGFLLFDSGAKELQC